MTPASIAAALAAAGVDALPGERWAPAPGAPGYLVSTEGRAFRLPHSVTQPTRYGGVCTRSFAGHLVDVGGGHPRLQIENRGTYHARADLGREVLAAFVRPPNGRELAVRLNGIGWDCRLVNLAWTGDRHADLLERFLAGDARCHDAADLEHAAIRLGVDRSVLGKVLTRERRRLHHAARSGPKSPAMIAAEIRAARQSATGHAMIQQPAAGTP